MELIKAKNTEDDFQAFLELEREFNSYYDHLGVGDQYGRVPADKIPVEEYKKEFLSYFDNDGYFVFARDNGQSIGYISGSLEKMTSGYKDGYVGHLDSIIITQKYRQKGFGKILIDSFFDWLKQQKVGICQLHVKAKNTEAISYYKNLGFEVDNLRMWKRV